MTCAHGKFIYGDAHGFGNLLDPWYIGEGMFFEIRSKVEDKMIQFCITYYLQHGCPNIDEMNEDDLRVLIYREYTRYKICLLKEKETDTLLFRMLKEGKLSVYDFWKSHGGEWSYIKDIALLVFTMSCSTASSERNFSTFGFLHTKAHNCLSEEHLEKLVYVKTNAFHLVDRKIFFCENCSNKEDEKEE